MNQSRKVLAVPLYIYMKNDYNWQKEGYPKEWHPDFWSSRVDEDKNRVFVEERQVQIDITDFNPVPKQVAALERERQAVLEQYQKSVAEINRQLSELLAIENSAPKGGPDNVT